LITKHSPTLFPSCGTDSAWIKLVANNKLTTMWHWHLNQPSRQSCKISKKNNISIWGWEWKIYTEYEMAIGLWYFSSCCWLISILCKRMQKLKYHN